MVSRYQVSAQEEGNRLDQFLAAHDQDLSRGKARKIIDLGGVHVDGRRVRKAGLLLGTGQIVEMYRDDGPLDPYRIAAEQVLFQDEYLIVLNKPSGIETQPTPARYKGTLFEALQVWLKRDRRFGRRLEIGMAQRLDRGTSGVIAFSIHPRAHKSLTSQLQSRTVSKVYLALVEGKPEPEAGSFVSNLLRDRRTGKMISVPQGGKEAVTAYQVVNSIEVPNQISLVEIRLITGRTHQIRAHFAEAGHPLLGDLRYGGSLRHGDRQFPRQCLHSYRLELSHPLSGDKILCRAELPEDMKIADW